MAEGFIGGHRDAIGQVKAADIGSGGDAKLRVRMFVEERFRQAGRFAAEDEHIATLIGHIEVRPRRFLREQPTRIGREGGRQFAPIIDHLPVKMLPVIEASPAEIVIIDAKTERPDEPELGADGHARAADTARVIRDFRLVEDDVEDGFVRVRHGDLGIWMLDARFWMLDDIERFIQHRPSSI